jgi:hypothetical protein
VHARSVHGWECGDSVHPDPPRLDDRHQETVPEGSRLTPGIPPQPVSMVRRRRRPEVVAEVRSHPALAAWLRDL